MTEAEAEAEADEKATGRSPHVSRQKTGTPAEGDVVGLGRGCVESAVTGSSKADSLAVSWYFRVRLLRHT